MITILLVLLAIVCAGIGGYMYAKKVEKK